MRVLLLIFLCLLLPGAAAAAGSDATLPEGLSRQEALRLGEKMYRFGILPSGEPMQAIVMGDIPVDGRMFTCDDCHQRSGLGSVEGTVITWPTNGRELYEPRRRTGAWRPPQTDMARRDERKSLPAYWQIEDVRPPYTDASLGMVLWTGVDPTGRKLNPVMPLYELEDRDMNILIYYLKNLSVDQAPGVDDATIRFATIVTDDVAEKDRRTMLATLQGHVDAHNSQSRHQERRAASGPFYKTEMHQAYRRWQLDVWELHGPENTWSGQLQDYYRIQPVFAILGGLAAGSWRPVHEFCEQQKIPAIFPLTELPVISDTDWYTLYFSKGYYGEGEAAARFLQKAEDAGPEDKVVVLYRRNVKTEACNRGFSEERRKGGRTEPLYLDIGPDRKLNGEFWQDIMRTHEPDVLILWLETDDLAGVDTLAGKKGRPRKIIVSATLLDDEYSVIPEEMRDMVYLTYPHSLPETREKRILPVKRWLQARNIPVTDLDLQAEIYFIGWMLSGSVKNMRSEFFRDYFLEGFDMMIVQDYAIAVYPRLTFGSGQRYASKGCYIVQLTGGAEPSLLPKSDWVMH